MWCSGVYLLAWQGSVSPVVRELIISFTSHISTLQSVLQKVSKKSPDRNHNLRTLQVQTFAEVNQMNSSLQVMTVSCYQDTGSVTLTANYQIQNNLEAFRPAFRINKTTHYGSSYPDHNFLHHLLQQIPPVSWCRSERLPLQKLSVREISCSHLISL